MNFKDLHSFVKKNSKEEFNRYKSWEHCYNAFGEKKVDADHLALHLAFYLASWGMYGGSSGLLQKDYKIHTQAVLYIIDYRKKLRCSKGNDTNASRIAHIIELKDLLSQYYSSYSFVSGQGKSKKIASTQTLISKVMLGTLACVPAFDRIYVDGVKNQGLTVSGFSEKRLIDLYDYIEKNKTQLLKFQSEIEKEYGVYYPYCKIVDSYFWRLGQLKDIESFKKNSILATNNII